MSYYRQLSQLATANRPIYSAASEELWRPGGEPRKKNKSCQTTFKQQLQLASKEEFASLAILINVFQ